MLHITAIPAFEDNYLWVLHRDDHAVVVDPGDARPVQAFLDAQRLTLDAILITHHHFDHIAGIRPLIASTPAPVYGPRAEHGKIPALTHLLDDGDRLTLLGLNFEVLAVPGHTLGHIAYYSAQQEPILFCGDSLFSAGCGRLFEGTPAQMHHSLQRLNALPATTRVYCTHEYTRSNLLFARAAEPENTDIITHLAQVETWRQAQQPSLPTTLALERRINPFLRISGQDSKAVQAFAELRRWKDGFKSA